MKNVRGKILINLNGFLITKFEGQQFIFNFLLKISLIFIYVLYYTQIFITIKTIVSYTRMGILSIKLNPSLIINHILVHKNGFNLWVVVNGDGTERGVNN